MSEVNVASTSSQNEEQPKESDEEKKPNWEDCPSVILRTILGMLPVESIAVCMFVNSKWNSICQHLLTVYNKWPEILDLHIPDVGLQFWTKSKNMDSEKIYRNSILWFHFEQASFNPYLEPIRDPHVEKLNVYRDNLIVLSGDAVRYYGILDHNLRKEFSATCLDFIENDYLIAQVTMQLDNMKVVSLFRKKRSDQFEMSGGCKILEGILFYCVRENICYTVNVQGALWTHTYHREDNRWSERFVARFYGNLMYMYGFKIYKDEAYLWLATGAVLMVDRATKCFEQVTQIKMPSLPPRRYQGDYMFHMFGFVFRVPDELPFLYRRYALDRHAVYSFECPNLTAMLDHGDMIFLGYRDGTVEIFRPRDYTAKTVLKTIRLQDYSKELDCPPAIFSMEVFEEVDCHHLFISTLTMIFHFKFEYENPDSLIYTEFPTVSRMELDYHTRGRKYLF